MLVVALVATGAGLLALPGRALGWSDNSFSATAEQQLFTLTNQARASAGLPTLRWDATLAGIARWRSQDMATRDYFSHNIPPTGEMVFDVMDQQGYCYQLAGENIGWNNYPDDQATDVVQNDFMNSPEHRQNIMGPAWNVAGIGAYKLADGRKFYTVLFANTKGCGSAPTPTAKPTPKPTPAPTARPTPAATPAPTEKPTPAATPARTPARTAAPNATPTADATTDPDADPDTDASPDSDADSQLQRADPHRRRADATPTATASADPEPGACRGTLPDGVSLRVLDPVAAPGQAGGLLESLLALIFGS